jgi:F-type H+-transporting ATPase subunit a
VIGVGILASSPMHQFNVEPIFGDAIGALTFSNASAAMVLAVAASIGFLLYTTAKLTLVPNRAQSAGEALFGFVEGMVRSASGSHGVKLFFPLVFTLFLFIFSANILGMFPYHFTPTAQAVVPAAMAIIVFTTVIVVGFAKNGLGFFKLFAPSGVPIYLMPLIIFIEIISFFSRPLSHTIRLWANIFAGHLLLKVLAGFVPMMLASGNFAIGLGALLPLALTVAIVALEFLVAFLQAYVFALLTSMYLNDALHPGH